MLIEDVTVVNGEYLFIGVEGFRIGVETNF